MCRWVAYMGASPVLLEDLLIRPKHSLCNQVHEHYLPGLLEASEKDSHLGRSKEQREMNLTNRLFNIDGVGIGYYTDSLAQFDKDIEGPMPAVFKSVRPPLNNPSFRSICANSGSECIFGHIRMAESAVTETNTHPFAFGRHLFQHNGSVGNFKSIHRAMLDLVSDEIFKLIQGTTDSEAMAGLFFTYLTSTSTLPVPASLQQSYPISSLKTALFRTLETIERLQHALPATEPFQPSALNIAITNGSSLLCLRYRPHPTESPPSLYYSETAGVLLDRRYEGHPDGGEEDKGGKEKGEAKAGHVVVASEPTTYKVEDWKLIPKNSVLWVERKGGEVVVEEVPKW